MRFGLPRARQYETARAQICCDGRSFCRLRCLPDRLRRLTTLQGVGIGFIGNAILALAGEASTTSGSFPKGRVDEG